MWELFALAFGLVVLAFPTLGLLWSMYNTSRVNSRASEALDRVRELELVVAQLQRQGHAGVQAAVSTALAAARRADEAAARAAAAPELRVVREVRPPPSAPEDTSSAVGAAPPARVPEVAAGGLKEEVAQGREAAAAAASPPEPDAARPDGARPEAQRPEAQRHEDARGAMSSAEPEVTPAQAGEATDGDAAEAPIAARAIADADLSLAASAVPADIGPVREDRGVAPAAYDRSPSPPVRDPAEVGSWTWFEAQIVGNWAGVLGSAAVALGMLFLGVYAALELTAFGRFMLVIGASGALLGLSLALARVEVWRPLSLWVRSAAATVTLIGCVASVAFTPMRWVESKEAALGVVAAGVVVNLVAGFANGGQLFASLHVVMGLVALLFLPAEPVVLVMAAAVAGAGAAVVTRHPRWGTQLVVSVTAFVLFHLIWVFRYAPGAEVTTLVEHGLPVALLGLVGATAFVTSYRRTLPRPEFDAAALGVHLWIEAVIGLSFTLHDMRGYAATAGLGAAAIALHRASAIARSQSVTWLFVCDRVVALGLATLGAATLYRHGWTGAPLILVIFAPSAVWLVNEARRDLRLPIDVPAASLHLGSLVLGGYALIALAPDARIAAGETPLERAAAVALAAVAVLAVSWWAEPRIGGAGLEIRDGQRSLLLGFTGAALVMVLDLCLIAERPEWLAAAVGASFAALLGYRRLASTGSLEVGYSVALIVVGAALLVRVGVDGPGLYEAAMAAVVFGAALGQVAAPAARATAASRGLALTVVAIASLVVSWRWLVGASAMLPGVAWVLLSVGWLELSRLDRAAPAAGLLRALGAATFFAFLVRHGLVDLQNEVRVGPVTVRGVVELYAAGAAAWWLAALTPKAAEDGTLPEPGIGGWFLEVALALVALFVALEVPAPWIAPTLGALALLALEGGAALPPSARLRGHAMLLHAVALVRVAFLSARLASPTDGGLDLAWWGAVAELGLAVALFLRFRWRAGSLREAAIPTPPGAGAVAGLLRAGQAWPSAWVLYPVFAAVALFLAWTFSHASLTFLWMAECLVMLGAAIALRDEVLRRIAMVVVVVVLGRLLLYDLRGSDVLVKALVFLGSGGLLIAMNALYHRFAGRFAEEGG